MSAYKSRKGQDLQDSFQGCMGRIMLKAGMATTKLLTERPHQDVIRDYSNVIKKSLYPSLVEMEGKQIIAGQRSNSPNKKAGGTPIKMLISQEMSGDMNSRLKPPGVVARLMGLDPLPLQQQAVDDGKIRKNGYLCNGLNGEAPQHQWQEDDYVDNSRACERKDYRDVYEVRKQPSKIEDQFPHKVIYEDDSYQRRMALVRQKFNEAKQLATDGKFLDSKEFHDAVEVLNSNRDLFLKFLEEPHSLYTNHLFEHQSLSPPSHRTRITVLKPSNAMERKGNKSMERQLLTDSDGSVGKSNKHYWSSGFSEPKGQDLLQPTRIVVLKPGPGKSADVETTLPIDLPTSLDERSSSGATVTDESIVLKDIAEGISQQGHESVGSSRKDETVSSSVVSNGYIGDESSFYRSESESMEDEVGSLSDSEIATSATDCSWDYTNKIGSPFSALSLNQASHFPEPSVIREAKKRLSERLAFVASNVNNQEKFQSWRNSSTLGEVLAIPKRKEEERCKEDPAHPHESFDAEDNLRAPSFPTSGAKFESTWENSCRNLSRSKSCPSNSSACEVDNLNLGLCSSSNSKPTFHEQVPKPKRGKFSLKDKVSSIFFPRSKKPTGDEPSRLPFVHDAFLQSADDTPAAHTSLVGFHIGSTERLMLPKDNSSKISLSGATPASDINNGLNQSSGSTTTGCLQAVSRSSPIESVARSLSRNAYSGVSSAKSLNPFIAFSKADREHEEYLFVRKLLSSIGTDNEQSMGHHRRWHSMDSPLNPSLLYDALHMVDEQDKCPETQSSRKLLFDSANAALLDINRSALLAAYPWGRPCHHPKRDDAAGAATVAEEVWATLKKGLAGEKWVPGEPGCCSIVVDGLVKEEVTGRQFDESGWLEVCEFSKEIAGEALEELVQELLSELSCDLSRCRPPFRLSSSYSL